MGHVEDGIPIGSPNRIDAVATSTMEDLVGRPEIKCHAGSRNPDESSAEILALLRSISWNVKDVMGNVDSLKDEIKGNQRDIVNLKEEMSSKMEEGFKKEQQARQQIQKEILQGFKNEENARQLVQRELGLS